MDDSTLEPGLYEAPETATGARTLERLLAEVTTVVLRAGWWRFEPGWGQAEHVRPNYTLFVPVEGDARYASDGHTFRLRPGTILLLPPNVPIGGGNDSRSTLGLYTVHFHARLYGAIDMPALYGLPTELRPDADVLTAIRDLAVRIVVGLAAAEPGCALAANGDCARLLALIWRELAGRKLEAASEGAARATEVVRLLPVLRAIESDYAQPLSLSNLAGLVHLHPAYFSTVFKRVIGVAPLEYLARRRMQHVRELLLTTDRSLGEIARATGYRDPFYLSRVFRRVQGVPPSQYRKSKERPAMP